MQCKIIQTFLLFISEEEITFDIPSDEVTPDIEEMRVGKVSNSMLETLTDNVLCECFTR